MSQEKLLAQVRLGYGKLKNDVSQVNKILKGINNGSKNLEIKVKLTGLEGSRYKQISSNISRMIAQFTRLNNLISNINKNSKGLGNIGRTGANASNRLNAGQTNGQAYFGNIAGLQGNIVKQSERTTAAGTSLLTSMQNSQGLITRTVSNQSGKIRSMVAEVVNANTAFDRSLNTIINRYKSLSAIEQTNLTNVRKTTDELTRLSSQYERNSTQYKKIMQQKQQMIKLEQTLLAQEQKRAAASNRVPLQQSINAYKMLSIEQQKMPSNIQKIIIAYDKVIAKEREEGREINKLIAARNQYQRTFTAGVRAANTEADRLANTVRRSGVGELLGMSGVASGDRRARRMDQFFNSVMYTTSAIAISKAYTALGELVSTNAEYEMGLIDLARTMDNVTTKSMERMGAVAIQTASKYGVALQEVQNSMTELARAGISDEDEIKALTETVALGLNTTEIKSADEMVGYLISTIKQLNLDMSDSNKIIDEWNYLSDKFAVHSNDFAEAVTKAGSSSKNLGLDLQDINSMVVVLGEATQASGREIGNAVRTLESYLLRPKTVGVLESYGIAVKKNAKEFLDFKTIMGNVDQALESFTDNSIATDEILRAIGGTWRKNWISLLADSWTEIDKINKQQDEALGYSAKENEKVMKTFSKQVEQLKVQFSEMALEIGKAGMFDSLRGLTSILSGTLKSFQALGPGMRGFLVTAGEILLVIKLLGFAMNKAFNVSVMQSILKTNIGLRAMKNVTLETSTAQQFLHAKMQAGMLGTQQYSAILSGLNNKQRVRNLSIQHARIQEQAYALAMRETAASSKALSIAMGLTTVGVTLAITAITSAISSYKASVEETKRMTEESIAQHERNNKMLQESTEYYVENYSKISEDEGVKTELTRIQEELNELYGEEADAIDLVNGKYETNIKLLKEKSRMEVRNLIRDLETEVAANKEKTFNMPQFGNKMSVGIKEFLGMDKQIGANYPMFNKGEELSYEEAYNKWIKWQEVIRTGNEKLINQELGFIEYIELNATMRKNLADEVKKGIDDILPLMNKEKELNAAKRRDIQMEVLSTKKLNTEEQELHETLLKTFDDMPIKNYKGAVQDLLKNVQKFDDSVKKGKPNEVNSLVIPGMDVQNFDIDAMVSDVYKDQMSEMAEVTGDFAEQLQQAKSAMSELNSMQEELNNTGKLTEDNLVAILERNSDLVNSLDNRKKLQETINKAVKQEASVAQAAYANKLMNSKKFFESVLTNNRSLYSALDSYYHGDLKQFTSLASAKLAVENDLISVIGKNWNKYYDTQLSALDARISNLSSMAGGYMTSAAGAADFNREMGRLQNLRTMLTRITKISSNLKSVKFTGASFSTAKFSSGSGSSSSSKDAVTKREALEKDYYTNINSLIARHNSLLSDRNSLIKHQEEMGGGLAERIEMLKEERSIIGSQISSYQGLYRMIQGERARLVSTLAGKGVAFSSSGNNQHILNAEQKIHALINKVNQYRNSTSTSGKNAYESYSNQLKTLQEQIGRFNAIQQQEIPRTLAQWRDMEIQFKDMGETIAQLKIEQSIEMYAKASERYVEALEDINFEISRLGGETELAKTSGLLRERTKTLSLEISYQQITLKKLLNTTDATIISTDAYKNKIKELEDGIRSNILSLQEMTRQQKENAKTAISGVETRINEILDKGLELRKEALTEELDLYKEHVDSIIQERERQYTAEDFEKNLKKEYENRQELVNKINRLNLDSSLESVAKRRELEKQLAEFDEKIADMKEKRQRDLIRQNLDDNMKNKELETNATIEAIDKEFDIVKRRQLIHEALLSESFDSLKTEIPELFEVLGDGVIGFFETFKEYEEHFGETLGDVSQTFSDTILPQLQNAFTAIDTYEERAAKLKIQALQNKFQNAQTWDEMFGAAREATAIRQQHGFEYENLVGKDLNKGYYTTGKPQSEEKVEKLSDRASVLTDDKFQEEKAKLRIRDLQYAYDSASASRKKEIGAEAIAIRSRFGWQYENLKEWKPEKYTEDTLRSYSGGINKGLVTETGNYLLHASQTNPEWVLTNSQMFNFVKNLATTLPSMSANNVNSNGSDVVVNINVNGNVDSDVIPQIREAGEEVVRNINKTLNKRGLYK